MEAIIAAALDAVGLILVAFIGYYGARKLGIGQNQEKLVSTLKQLIDAQDRKIAGLENDKKETTLKIETLEAEYKSRIEQLEKEVAELRTLTIAQAKRNEELEEALEKYKVGRRRKAVSEGGE